MTVKIDSVEPNIFPDVKDLDARDAGRNVEVFLDVRIEGKTAPGDYQEFRARGRFSSLADEPFAEDDGELGLGLEPFARRPFPFVSRVVQNQV